MGAIEPPQIRLPGSEVLRVRDRLRERCRAFLSAETAGEDQVEARQLWANFLRQDALLALLRAAERIQEESPAPDQLAKWGLQCGAEAIPYLLHVREHSKEERVRRASLVAMVAACAVVAVTSADRFSRGKVPPGLVSSDPERPGNSPIPAERIRVLIEGIDESLTLADTLAITRDWEATNRRRLALIARKAAGELTPESNPAEWAEFEHLQNLAGIKRQLADPLPIKELAEIEADLRGRGLWQGA